MCLARQKLAELSKSLGSWAAVAQELAPYYQASGGLWWKVYHGQSQNEKAVKAVLAYCGKGPKQRKAYSRPCFDADTLALLDARRRPHESRSACLRRLLSGGKE